MKNHPQFIDAYYDSISLQDAMTKELPQEIQVRIWHIPGLHVDANIPKNAKVQETIVRKSRTNKFILALGWIVEGDLGERIDTVTEFSSLEELKDKFPKLFELNGDLYAFE